MENRLKYWHYFLFIFLLSFLSMGLILNHVAYAQTETVLAVSPSETDLYFNGELSAQVQIYITDVDSLNAFDITLFYDGGIVAVTSYSPGGFLVNPTCVKQINDPGYFRYSCTQLGQSGVSGSGPLINLTFTGIAAGVTSVTIDEESLKLPDGNNQPITATLQHGSIKVGYLMSNVIGAIFLQGRAGSGGVPATLGTGALFGQGPYTTLSTPALGLNLEFGPVPHDTYTVTTAQPGYLYPEKTVSVSGALSLPPLRLLAGDVLGNQSVGLGDLDAIRDAYGLLGPGLPADVNGDGVVDVRDLALAGGNFGLTAQAAYADWLP